MRITKISAFKASTATAALGLAMLSAPVFAQDSTDDTTDTDEVIVVTGSLITNPNLESSSPVNVVSEKEMELRQANVAEELLRELPGAVPSIGSAVNNGNGGASFVNLRNVGSNRNVVLIDGVRLVPAELNGRFDLNNIPLALIQRVDVLTGGASTTYGADAVAGVVNFITRRDFAGMDLTVSEQITEEGDGNVFRADLTLGANFDDGRGNAVLSVGYQEADAVYQGDRDYGRYGLSSSSGAGGGSGTSVPSRFSLPDPDGPSGPVVGGTFQVTNDGTAFRPTTAFQNFNFNPYNVYQTPFNRYNIYGAANYEVSDTIEVYARGLFSKNTVDTIIAPSGSFGVSTQLNLNNPFLTTALRDRFCVANGIDAATCAAAAAPGLRPGDAAYRQVTTALFRRAVEVGPRISSYRTTFFDTRIGARGKLTDTIDWDIFGSYGESDNLQVISGYTLNSRVRQSMLAVTDASGAPVCINTANSCQAVNWFGPQNNASWTPEAIDFLSDSSTVGTNVSMAQVRGVLSGDFGVAIPMANDPISFAVGAEYRNYSAAQASDSLAQGGDLGGAGGAAPNINGGYKVEEVFGELVVPVVQDRPFFHDLTLEAGIRYSHYKVDAPGNPTFNTTTWKVGGSWSPTESLKIRGNYARAVRAPNINELFSPVNTGLTNLNDDPCATYDDAGLLIPGRSASGPAGTLRAICLAQGATTGNVASIAQPISGQANSTGGGNLDLQPEKSTSWSVGAVFQPDFVSGLTMSIDYWNIKVKGAISSPTPGDAIAACFGANPTSPPTGAETSLACTQIRRDPLTGGLNGDPATTAGLFLSLSNLGTIATDGVDFTAGYRTDLGFAGLDLNTVLTWVNSSTFQATPTSFNRECIGLYSENCMPPQSKWQWSTRATLDFEDFDVSFLWRHLDGLKYEGILSDWSDRGFSDGDGLFVGAIPAINTGTLAGRQVDFNKISSYDYFDLTTRFNVSKNFTMTFAIRNLLDKEPPLVGGEAGSTTFNSGNTFPSTYDALGRRFTVTGKIRF